MTTSAKVEDDVYKRLKEYCNKNGLKIQFAISRAVEDWLDNKTE